MDPWTEDRPGTPTFPRPTGVHSDKDATGTPTLSQTGDSHLSPRPTGAHSDKDAAGTPTPSQTGDSHLSPVSWTGKE